jgi:DNA polymerase-3 subunit alpha
MCRVQELVDRAQALKLDAVGIADRNSTYAWVPLAVAARRARVQPVFGVRLVLATSHGQEEELSELVLYAKTDQGLHNLLRLVSQAHLEDAGSSHAITLQDLERCTAGVIALDGGSSGAIQKALRQGDVRRARRMIGTLRDRFETGSFFVQVERHGTAEELRVEPHLLRLARRAGVGLVAAGNTCYIEREDAEAYEVLRCLGSQRSLQHLEEDEGFRNRHHLHSPSEMKRLYQDLPAALENSRHIAEQCRLDLSTVLQGTYALAEHAGGSGQELLKQRCEQGACERYGTPSYQDVPAAARTRIAHELALIEEKELASCFLVVQDVVRYAKEEGIPVGPGRGSLAGSLVAWVLEITDIDPLRFGLQFESRLMKASPTVPAMEIEVGHRWREDLIRKLEERAGRPSVVRMSILARLHGRSLLNQVGEVLGVASHTLDTVDRLSRAQSSNNVQETLDNSNRLRRLFQDDAQARRLLEVCSRLEGLPYHASLQSGGLLLLPGEAMQRVALARSSQGLRAQATDDTAEQLGWARLVLHGSTALSAQHATERRIQEKDAAFQIDDIALDDEPTWRRIAHGDGAGLPGLEMPVARTVVRAVQPARLSDLVACLTLASPVAQASGLTERFLATGRSGRVPEALRDVLDETGGWILYEEQVLQIAERIAGYTLEQAGELCDALRREDLSRLVQERARFLSGALEQGIELAFAERVLETLMAVRLSGESRGHATAQALVLYRTAWMLTHHGEEMLVELLNNSIGQSTRQQRIMRMAVDQGCRILKVDINRSGEWYDIESGAIRLALTHVPSIGEATAAMLTEARRSGGAFRSVHDVVLRVPGLHRAQVDALIEAGALADLAEVSDADPGKTESTPVASGRARPGANGGRKGRQRVDSGRQMTLAFGVPPQSESASRGERRMVSKSLPEVGATRQPPVLSSDRPMASAGPGRLWVAGTLFGRRSGLGNPLKGV